MRILFLLAILCSFSRIAKAESDKIPIIDSYNYASWPMVKERQLFSEDSNKADWACVYLYKLSISSIPYLLEISDSKERFHGNLFDSIYSDSALETLKPSVGLISLFLIEAIAKKDLFHSDYPVLCLKDETLGDAENEEKREERLKIAQKACKQWWKTIKPRLPLEDHLWFDQQYARGNKPLKGTGLEWYDAWNTGRAWRLKAKRDAHKLDEAMEAQGGENTSDILRSQYGTKWKKK